MNNTELCRDLRDTYLDRVANMGRAVPQLHDARRAVENTDAQIADLLQQIRLAQASAAAGRAAAGRSGRLGVIPSVAIAINSAQKVSRLERELASARVRLAEAETLVRKLEQEISGYQHGIENTPIEMTRSGCGPV